MVTKKKKNYRRRKGRPRKDAGLKTSVTTPERVKVIVELMVANFQAKATAVIGASTAAGGVNYGGARVGNRVPGLGQELGEEDYVDTWDEVVPPMSASSGGDWQESGARPVPRTLRMAGLMTLEKGGKIIDSTASRLMTFCRAAMSGEKPSWRRWVTFAAALRIVKWEQKKAHAELKLAAYPKGQRRGWQRISTSRTARLPRGQLVTFSGKPAWSGFRGRPPLPEQVWLNRYRSRLEKRRAKYKGRPRKRGKKAGTGKVRKQGPTVPPTLGQRPPYELKLPKK